MAGKIDIKMNDAGIIAALKSPGVVAELQRRARHVQVAAGATGGSFMVTTRVGRTRPRVSVITANDVARRAEAIDRALTRALDAARG